MDKPRLLKCVSSLLILLPLATQANFRGFGQELDGYIKESAHRYQVSESMLRGLVKFEDGWTGNISPTGATGVGQFTMGTWNFLANTVEGYRIGMRPVTAKNRNTRADPRRNNYVNTLATGLYARWHIEKFAERGIKPTDANLYLAHNIGLDGLHRALLGRSNADDIRNMRRNGMKRGMSVKDFIAYQSQRYTLNKNIANFTSPSTTTAQNVKVKNTAYVDSMPKASRPARQVISPDVAINWIEPSDTQGIYWVNPTN